MNTPSIKKTTLMFNVCAGLVLTVFAGYLFAAGPVKWVYYADGEDNFGGGNLAPPQSGDFDTFTIGHKQVYMRYRHDQTDKVAEYPGSAAYTLTATINHDFVDNPNDAEELVVVGSSGDEDIDAEHTTVARSRYDTLPDVAISEEYPLDYTRIDEGDPTDSDTHFVLRAYFVGMLDESELAPGTRHWGDARMVRWEWSTHNGANNVAPRLVSHVYTFEWAPGQHISDPIGWTTYGMSIGVYRRLVGWTWDPQAGGGGGGEEDDGGEESGGSESEGGEEEEEVQ